MSEQQAGSLVLFDERFSQWLAVNFPDLSFEHHAEIVEGAGEIVSDLFSCSNFQTGQDRG